MISGLNEDGFLLNKMQSWRKINLVGNSTLKIVSKKCLNDFLFKAYFAALFSLVDILLDILL